MAAFTPSPPNDLTIPDEGSKTLRAVWSMSLRKLFEDLKALKAPTGLRAGAQGDYRSLREVFVGFLPGNPGAIASLLRRPVVSAPLRCLRDGAGDANELMAEVVAQSLFELTLVGALEREVIITTLPATLLSPHRGVHLPLVGASRVSFGPDGVTVDGVAQEPRRGAFHDVEDQVVLCTLDNNPLRDHEAHPDKTGNAVDLGDHTPAEWVDALRTALGIIERALPDFRDEIALLLQQVVPVGFDAERHLSASYREALGSIYLTLHPNPLTMAEAIVHEVSHNKLNALLELDPLLENAYSPLYTSPVRPDPRPLLGILLAVHAFQPVQVMLHHLRESGEAGFDAGDLERRIRQVRDQNHQGAAVLREHAVATPVGRGVLDEIARWDHQLVD